MRANVVGETRSRRILASQPIASQQFASQQFASQQFGPEPARHDGYVLLAVLAALVLVITVLGKLANVSLRRGLEAADAERALQQRWAAVTLQRALLDQAPDVFQLREDLYLKQAQASQQLSPPVSPPVVRDALTLGGVTFDLMLADEDAKLNLNTLYHRLGSIKTQQILTKLLETDQAVVVDRRAVRLIPAVKPRLVPRELSLAAQQDQNASDDDVPDAFRSWGEVFDLSILAETSGASKLLPNATTDVTCWGTGQLNIRRASDAAILAAVATVVQDGGAQRFLKRFRDQPGVSLSVMLQSEVSLSQHRDRLRDLLSESSTNFSLWMDASTAARGSLRYFNTMQRDEEGVTRHRRFLYP